jgi:FKBP-type peptidyl-prolyl cis-trans isomerase 2
MMREVAMWHDGDLVEFHFEGALDSGAVFDTSRGRRARVFVLGRGQLIPAFEAQLREMAAGERRRFRIEAADAYGEHDPALVVEAPRAEAPEGVTAGDEVPLTGGRPATVVAVSGDMVTLDANHPLAGQALTFEVELVAVTPATATP